MVRRSHLGKKGDTHKDDLATIIIIILRKLATWHSLRRLLYFFFLLQLNSFYLILDTLPPSQSQKCQIFLVRLGYTSCYYAKTWAMSLKSQTKQNTYVGSVRSYLSATHFSLCIVNTWSLKNEICSVNIFFVSDWWFFFHLVCTKSWKLIFHAKNNLNFRKLSTFQSYWVLNSTKTFLEVALFSKSENYLCTVYSAYRQGIFVRLRLSSKSRVSLTYQMGFYVL